MTDLLVSTHRTRSNALRMMKCTTGPDHGWLVSDPLHPHFVACPGFINDLYYCPNHL